MARDKKSIKSKVITAGKTARENILLILLMAIIFALSFTPIGFIKHDVIRATLLHVPVIVGSILLGYKKGALLGATFGLASIIKNTSAPVLLSFVFSPLIPVPTLGRGSLSSIFICFLPRILVGIIPYFLYRLICKFLKEDDKSCVVCLALTGAFSSLFHSSLVMCMIYFIFKDAYALALSVPVESVALRAFGIFGINGTLEGVVAALITVAVCFPVQKFSRSRTSSTESSKKVKPVEEKLNDNQTQPKEEKNDTGN